MRPLSLALPAAITLGLAACALPFPGGPQQTLTFPAEEEDPPVPTPIPGALVPGATASFVAKVVPKTALDANKAATTQYCPFIEFEVQDAKFSPRWPGATLAYSPGARPLPQMQRDLFRRAVEKLNTTVGFKIFSMLSDGASADIPVTDSTSFSSHTVLGETEARVVSRYTSTTLQIDFSEKMRLRSGLSDSLFYRVALHELGHAAGLEHNPRPNTLMNKGTSSRTPMDFAPEERESLKLLYSLPDVPLKPHRIAQSLPGESLLVLIFP
ncbi:MAG: matrixin family metalloprotease [Candidatus Sericytochromatia bacterium]|nr:matrixin family metalloprotease [Candidatus Tanganyikabacteria bacterium]